MEGFDHILNWKLKPGSHRFPGPDGGTCINEAALVAAGFPYRPVRQAEDMPDCFSRPICRLAMALNDNATDGERQRLLPFVTRLACADAPEIERERATFIAAHAGRTGSFERGIEVLEGALAIGRSSSCLAPDAVRDRMEAARRVAPKPRSLSDVHLVTKVKSWFGMAKAPEPAD